jgi:hypothetical protein
MRVNVVRVKFMLRKLKSRIAVEELANPSTHGIGLALSIAGFVVLIFSRDA